MNTREFVERTPKELVGIGAAASLTDPVSAPIRSGPGKISYARQAIPPVQVPPYRGHRYEAIIPATLDLAERAQIALEGVLTSSGNPDYDYEIYLQTDINFQPPIAYMSGLDFFGCQPKYLEAMPLLRSITGSDVNQHVDKRLYEVSQLMVADDGLTYSPVKGRPWALFDEWRSVLRSPNLPPPDVEHIFDLYANGRNLLALCNWHMRDPDNPFSKKLLQTMVGGIEAIGVEKNDALWIPYQILYRTPDQTLAAAGAYGGQAGKPMPLKQALDSANGSELTISPPACTDAGGDLQGVARYFRMTGDERAGEIAGRLARYVRQAYEDDGTFKWGHVHLNLMSAISLLDYADAVGDKDLERHVQRIYEYGRSLAVPLVGFFPEFRRPGHNLRTSESCADADATILAIKLSDYGVGDYWEDVDRYVRNHLTEAQLLSTDWAYRVHNLPAAEGKEIRLGVVPLNELGDLARVEGFMVREHAVERIRGCFATHASINDWFPGWAGDYEQREGHSGCCSGNGSRALYYAWRSILKQEKGVITVNLLLNRASPWADVDSHIPYTGRVDIHIKAANQLLVRVPEWVPTHAVKLGVNGQEQNYGWQGRYLDAGHVREGQQITIEFPIEERTVTVEPPFGEFSKVTLVLKGNDVVEIDPRGPNYPFYQREHYRQGQTLWKRVSRFEPAELFSV